MSFLVKTGDGPTTSETDAAQHQSAACKYFTRYDNAHRSRVVICRNMSACTATSKPGAVHNGVRDTGLLV
jgi:hypothetical protein